MSRFFQENRKNLKEIDQKLRISSSNKEIQDAKEEIGNDYAPFDEKYFYEPIKLSLVRSKSE